MPRGREVRWRSTPWTETSSERTSVKIQVNDYLDFVARGEWLFNQSGQDPVTALAQLLLRSEYNSPPVETHNRFSVPGLSPGSATCSPAPDCQFIQAGTDGDSPGHVQPDVHRFRPTHWSRLAAAEVAALGAPSIGESQRSLEGRRDPREKDSPQEYRPIPRALPLLRARTRLRAAWLQRLADGARMVATAFLGVGSAAAAGPPT